MSSLVPSRAVARLSLVALEPAGGRRALDISVPSRRYTSAEDALVGRVRLSLDEDVKA